MNLRARFVSTFAFAVVASLAAVRAFGANVDVNVACCSFSPPAVTIDAGDTVTWHYTDALTMHTVTSGSGPTDPAMGTLFNTPMDPMHLTFVYQFNTSGSFPYFCTPHFPLGMRGTVTVRCNLGDVNTAGSGRQDVLTVNGSPGDATQTVTVSVGQPISVSLASSNGGPTNANYALWVWHNATPSNRSLFIVNQNVGCTFDPTPLSGGSPQPIKCLHSPAFASDCGAVPVLPSAASTPWTRTRALGFSRAVTFTLQAVMEDSAAGNPSRVSVSNVVILRVQFVQ
jgi:plastocyanin